MVRNFRFVAAVVWRATFSGAPADTSGSIASDAGLSQEGFARTLGVHRTYLGGLERGEAT